MEARGAIDAVAIESSATRDSRLAALDQRLGQRRAVEKRNADEAEFDAHGEVQGLRAR
jgi:hypothetical protein